MRAITTLLLQLSKAKARKCVKHVLKAYLEVYLNRKPWTKVKLQVRLKLP